MEYIHSKENKTIKYIQSLSKKKYRQLHGTYLVEGIRGITDLLSNDSVPITLVVIKESDYFKEDIQVIIERLELGKIPVFKVADDIYKSLEETVQGQGIIGVVKKKNYDFSCFKADGKLYILLDSVQDPGNLGTIIRTAVAVGADGLFLTKGSVDPYNDKTVRSSMSALHYLPIYENITDEEVDFLLTESGLHTYVTTLQDSVDFNTVPYQSPALLILGNEGNGVRPTIVEKSQTKIKIPLYGPMESLNLSVATGIALYKIKENSGK